MPTIEELIKEQTKILRKYLDKKIDGLIEAMEEKFRKNGITEEEIERYTTPLKQGIERFKEESIKGFYDIFGTGANRRRE